MPYLRVEDASGGIEIYYEESGQGEAVVLIGGLTSTLEVWGLQVPALARRYRVITPDNRGSGRTRIPNDDGVRSHARFAQDILGLIDGLGLDRVHLVGASLGGIMVQAFAVAHPERLISLSILCSTPGEKHGVPVDAAALADLVQGSADIAQQGQAGGAAQLDGFTRAVVHPDTPGKRPEALEFFFKTKDLHPHSDDEIARRQRDAGSDTWEGLGTLAVPTLALTGDADRLVPPENSRILAARIPNGECKILPGGGHIFFIEQPEATNAALLDFLGRHPA